MKWLSRFPGNKFLGGKGSWEASNMFPGRGGGTGGPLTMNLLLWSTGNISFGGKESWDTLDLFSWGGSVKPGPLLMNWLLW
jgi:hypothetical protein